MVQPPPGPSPTNNDAPSIRKAGTNSQKLMLFMRGKAMSGAPIISGTNQLPKPPIIAGITMKNTMMRPCAVMNTFHMCSAVFRSLPPPMNCAHHCRYWIPGSASSTRMMPEMPPPMIPAMIAKIRYIVPMSLWLVDMNQRAKKPGL
jgi:hypothetical protein